MYDLLQLVGPLLSILGPAAGAVYTWLATRQAAARKEIEALTTRLDEAELKLLNAGHNSMALADVGTKLADHDRRLLSMENEFKHLPAREDISELKLAISELKGTVKAMGAELTGFGRVVANIDTYLRKGDEK
jgi:predicted  nucleic acid-binding Zn-ribbon protein